MSMSDASAKSPMQYIFVSFDRLLRQHGLARVVSCNPKAAMGHLHAVIEPWSFGNCLEFDSELDKGHQKKDFNGFLRHAISISEAFKSVDRGRCTE